MTEDRQTAPPSSAPPDAASGPSNVARMPDQLSRRHVRRRLLQLAAVGVVIATVVLALPGLSEVRTRLAHASFGWLALAPGLEVLSVLSYIVIFRTVFCPRMRWGFSGQIAVSELAANSLLPVSGAGGLALGAWALNRGGMSAEDIGRKTVAFFFLTSLGNVSILIVFALLYATGVLGPDANATVTYLFGALALASVVIVLAIPLILRRTPRAGTRDSRGRWVAGRLQFARRSLAEGVPDAVLLLRRRPVGVLGGSLGTTVFDLAVLGVAFRAIGAAPPIGVLVLGYLIGMLGGNVPVPGGIGGIDAGLIGTLTLFHEPLAATVLAVLTYHIVSLWVPVLLGSVSFLRLRATLQREERLAAMCTPVAEPIETIRLPAPVTDPV
jgi:uncharacterized membrane protein YbhN (UPF0104 family)